MLLVVMLYFVKNDLMMNDSGICVMKFTLLKVRDHSKVLELEKIQI